MRRRFLEFRPDTIKKGSDLSLIKKIVSLLLLCCLLALWPGTCLAADYRITDQELTKLEQIFNQLEQSNDKLLNELSLSQQDLKTAKVKLEEYQKDLAVLQTQLRQLREESTKARANLQQAQISLEKANESLNKFEKEARLENNRLRTQRNLGILAAVIMAFR